jgi:hypothetical protein
LEELLLAELAAGTVAVGLPLSAACSQLSVAESNTVAALAVAVGQAGLEAVAELLLVAELVDVGLVLQLLELLLVESCCH